ncbi:MAG: hypothetical protein WBK48_08990, partial [Dethiobacteria bacterium]
SNLRPLECESSALPLSYAPLSPIAGKKYYTPNRGLSKPFWPVFYFQKAGKLSRGWAISQFDRLTGDVLFDSSQYTTMQTIPA